MNSSYYTQEKLVDTAYFYLLQSLSDDLPKAGENTSEEYELLSKKILKTFGTLFLEKRPKMLDK